jgi:hypothetical protein
MNDAIFLSRTLAKLTPELEVLAGLAVEAMKLSENAEEAFIFCIEPSPELEHFISQLGSKKTESLHFDTLITSYESKYIQGIGDQGFAHHVSLMVKEESRERYLQPAEPGKVAGFLFSRGLIFRFEIYPKSSVIQ